MWFYHYWIVKFFNKETLIIDVRNNFEFEMGTFRNSINPKTKSFSEFKKFIKSSLSQYKKRNIALFCTGGIRCEKATSYLLSKGYTDVYHLKGGILKYLEEVTEENTLWDGECFVFDQRVALNHDLLPGIHSLCYACGMPLSPRDTEHSSYIRGVRCLYCEDQFSEQDRARFLARQNQYDQYSHDN